MAITTTSGTLVTVDRDGTHIGITIGDGELDITAADLRDLLTAGLLEQVVADAESDPLGSSEKEFIDAMTKAYSAGSPALRAELTRITS